MGKQQYIEAGKIVNTHGVAGEVKIDVWLDSPQKLNGFKRLFLNGIEYKLLSGKIQKNCLIAKLQGVDTVNDAMRLRETVVYIDRDDAKLPTGSFFIQDIIGAAVFDEQGRQVGVLQEVLESPASRIFVVRGEQEHLIPEVAEFIKSADPNEGKIIVHMIEGM